MVFTFRRREFSSHSQAIVNIEIIIKKNKNEEKKGKLKRVSEWVSEAVARKKGVKIVFNFFFWFCFVRWFSSSIFPSIHLAIEFWRLRVYVLFHGWPNLAYGFMYGNLLNLSTLKHWMQHIYVFVCLCAYVQAARHNTTDTILTALTSFRFCGSFSSILLHFWYHHFKLWRIHIFFASCSPTYKWETT